jgi:hypothetical protein
MSDRGVLLHLAERRNDQAGAAGPSDSSPPGLHEDNDAHHGDSGGRPVGVRAQDHRTRSAGGFAMNSSISHTRVAERAVPAANPARPTVAPAIQGDHAPAANAESSKRKPNGGCDARAAL